MNWLVFALLAPLIFTLVNFVDKYIVEREVKDYRGMVIFTAIMALAAGTIFFILGGFPLLPAREMAIILFTGALTAWGAALYFPAISGEDASNVIIFFQITPIFTLILSMIFLDEVLTAGQWLGFILIFASVIGVSVFSQPRHKREGKWFQLSRGFFLILGVDVMVAISFVVFRSVIQAEIPFAAIITYESWGITLGGLVLYLFVPTIRRAFHVTLGDIRKQGLAVIALNETTFVVAKLLNFVAISIAPSVALVSVLMGTQVFFGILLGWLLTTVLPAIFKEDITRSGLMRRGALAAVLFAGIILVN